MEALQIPLRRRDGSIRAYALVDAEDYEWAKEHRWSLGSHGYAMRGTYNRGTGDTDFFLLHREILGLQPGDELQSDHLNRDRLDNRRANLRVLTHAQNQQNRGARSPWGRGVSFDKSRGKWRAQVMVNRVRHALGRFDTPEEAAETVREFRAEHMPFVVE